jgi:hypothetical protein
MEENVHLSGLAASGYKDTRKAWHFGNVENWSPAVAKNTGHPKHSYESYRNYFASKPGQKAPKMAGQAQE